MKKKKSLLRPTRTYSRRPHGVFAGEEIAWDGNRFTRKESSDEAATAAAAAYVK